MKLLKKDYYLRHKRIAKQRTWQKHGRVRPKKNQDICHQSTVDSLTIEAPEVIGLHSKTLHSNLTRFLSTLRKESLRQRRIRIDFSKTNKVISTGMLLMLAEIDRLRITLGDQCKITCSYPQDQTVEKVFQQIGFFNILGKAHRLEINEDDVTVKNWRYASGVSVNPKDADILLKAIKNKIPKESPNKPSVMRESPQHLIRAAHEPDELFRL